jgi:hypothetical protein
MRTVLGIVSAAILATGCSHGAPAPSAVASQAHAGTATASTVALAGWSMIATTKGTVPRFVAPGGRQDGTVPARWYGAQSSLPVIGQQAGWYEVRLVTRPNGSTAWVRATNVTITGTPYRIVVNLTTRHLQLFRSGKQIMNALRRLERSRIQHQGQYFVALFERSPSAGYGRSSWSLPLTPTPLATGKAPATR